MRITEVFARPFWKFHVSLGSLGEAKVASMDDAV